MLLSASHVVLAKSLRFRSIPVASGLILVYYGTVVPSLSFSLLILHERPAWVQLLGMGIIICGIFLSVRSEKRYES